MRGTVIVLGLLGLVWQIGAALAQTYPTKPVRVIVAQSAGANMDTIARIVTPKMSDALGQQFVIDNRGGAGGIIGIELGARATSDGYTLTVGGASSMVISSFTYKKLAFDTLKDFELLAHINQ